MTELSTPVWIELALPDYRISQKISWPMLGVAEYDLSSISSFLQSFLDDIIPYVTLKLSQMNATIFLLHQPERNCYRGIVLPSSFPSLDALIREIFQAWSGPENSSFQTWLEQFFKLRIDPSYLQHYQLNEEYNIKLPPLFLLNQQQINGVLLLKLRNELNSVQEINAVIIENCLELSLPNNYRHLLYQIPAEKELSMLHLINAYLHTKEMIDFDEYLILKDLIAGISPLYPDIILLNFLQIRLTQEKRLDERLFQYLLEEGENRRDLTLILTIRVIILHFKQQNNFEGQDEFNQYLLQNAPALSWSKRLDLINAQIGLASTSVTKGDYFRAMTFYSFARQGFNSIGMNHLQKKMETEFQRVSTFSATQQLQTALYLLNHHNTDRSTLLLLIDGIQSTLTHFIRYKDEAIAIEDILSPLLVSASRIMDFNREEFNKLISVNISFDEMIEVANLLTNSQNRRALTSRMQTIVEQLSFKDQKIIERISVFYDDGRHIGDYHMIKGSFKMMGQDANQALFSSAMSAVSMLISEATASDADVDEISIGNKKVIYDTGEKITFCLICNSSSANLKQLLRNVVANVEKHYSSFLSNWSGNINQFSDLPEFLSSLSFYAIDFSE